DFTGLGFLVLVLTYGLFQVSEMEFGCRYIYVDESRGDAQQHCHPSSVNIPQKGIDVPDQAPYDNFKCKGSACSEVNGMF
ncbi:hypothetical protein AB205_0012460, partial [Aquarana catesbeiana]